MLPRPTARRPGSSPRGDSSGYDSTGSAGPEPAPSLLTLLINMFMAPTPDITVPLYGHLCFTDCAVAHQGGYCSIASVLEACPASCGVAGDKEYDTLASAGSKPSASTLT